MLRAWRAMVRKDLLLFFTDRRGVLMSFVAPIAIASFFGFIFGGNRTTETARVTVRVVDEDGSAISRRILKGLSEDKLIAVEGGGVDEAREAVRRGKSAAAVVIPKGFGDAAGRAFFGTTAEKPALDVLHDPSRGMELAMVRGLLTQHVMQAVSAEMFGGAEGRALTQSSLAELRSDNTIPSGEKQALSDMLTAVNRYYARPAPPPGAGALSGIGGGGITIPYSVKEEAVTSRTGVAYNSFAHSFAGMGVQFLLFACIDLAVLMLLERQMGLWKRLRAAPLARSLLLAAKATSGTLISLMTLGVSFSFGMVVFGIRIQGSLPGFLAVCLATALMSACFGLMIAAIGGTPSATRGVSTLVVLMMVMLGGAWVPVFVFPAWLQKATLAVPARWAVDGLDATTWRGADFVATLPAIGVLLGFAALFGLIAVARFRWEAE